MESWQHKVEDLKSQLLSQIGIIKFKNDIFWCLLLQVRLQTVSFAVWRKRTSDLIVNVALKPLYIHEEGRGNKT